jgi:hypothetical protein
VNNPEGSTEVAFVNKEDDLNVPIGRPGSQSHLPELHNNQHNQLTHNQDGTLLIPPSSATGQVVVMMLVRLQTLKLMKATAKVTARYRVMRICPLKSAVNSVEMLNVVGQ